MADGAQARAKRARTRRERSPTTPDPIEIAMEAEAHDTSPDSPARRVLLKQEKLIGWQIASERAGAALKVLTALVGVLLLACMGFMAWSAHNDRSLRIAPFETPPDFIDRGLSGKVLAGQVQDRLLALQQNAFNADQQADSLRVREAEGPQLMVVIPETGVSLEQIQSLFDAWFSRRTEVEGALSRVAGGEDDGALALDLRVGIEPGVRLIQADGDVDALVERAAEEAYRITRPVRYASWIATQGRDAEANAVLAAAARRGSNESRALALVRLRASSLDETLANLAEAVRLDPRLPDAWNSLGALQRRLGQEGAAFMSYRRAIQSGSSDPRFNIEPGSGFSAIRLGYDILAGELGDLQAMYCENYRVSSCDGPALMQAVATTKPVNFATDPFPETRPPGIVRLWVSLHDTQNAAALLARPRLDLSARPGVLVANASEWLDVEYAYLAEREDWPALLASQEAREAITAQSPADQRPDMFAARRAYALSRLGRVAEAEALFAGASQDCDVCLRFRARAAAARGDAAGADRWFAAAAKLAGVMPQAETEWARALLDRGDTAAAITKARAAHRRAPRFADPLQVWGEALLAKGDFKGAIRKFETAAKLTPRWGRLHLKWGRALAGQGIVAEARNKWLASARMDLLPAERAEVQSLLAK